MGTKPASARTKLLVVPVEASMKGEPTKFLYSLFTIYSVMTQVCVHWYNPIAAVLSNATESELQQQQQVTIH